MPVHLPTGNVIENPVIEVREAHHVISGFEPTPPKRTELESVALDHSATDASYMCTKYIKASSEIRTRDLLLTKQMH